MVPWGLKWHLGGGSGLRFENNIYLKLSFTKFVQIVAPKSKMAPPHGPGFEPKKYKENIKKSSSESLGSDLYQVCSYESCWVQNYPTTGGLGFNAICSLRKEAIRCQMLVLVSKHFSSTVFIEVRTVWVFQTSTQKEVISSNVLFQDG